MDYDSAKLFCERWLPVWTGNRPEQLIEAYAPEAFYRDPAVPGGLRGRDAILAYLRKLLSRNPAWLWTAEEIFPTEKGFCFKWRAEIPVPGKETITETGMDIVEVSEGKITRNEVYFDRSSLLA
jgi:hypothetical protein